MWRRSAAIVCSTVMYVVFVVTVYVGVRVDANVKRVIVLSIKG